MKLTRIALAAGVLAALLLLLAGPGVRLGLWDFRTGFSLLKYGAYLGIAAIAGCLLLLLIRRPPRREAVMLLLGVACGAVAAGVPWSWMRVARGVPAIHDITTDTDDPPAFVAILPLRANASNSATYGGPEVAAKQLQGYPDIRPLELAEPPAAAFDRAVGAAKGMGWAMVATDSSTGRIEATATTGWFGFKDDVVIRVRPSTGGSRIDVRSESRVGGSDVGTNARRIRAYFKRLQQG